MLSHLSDKLHKAYIESIKDIYPEEYKLLTDSYLKNAKNRVDCFPQETYFSYKVSDEISEELIAIGEQLDSLVEFQEELSELKIRRNSRYIYYRKRKEK